MLVALGGISFPVFWLELAAILLLSSSASFRRSAQRFRRRSSSIIWLCQRSALRLLGGCVHRGGCQCVRDVEALVTRITSVSRAPWVNTNSGSSTASRCGIPTDSDPCSDRRHLRLVAGNAILIEAVFSRPGVGSTMLKAILARDYQLVQAGVLVLATGVVLINAILDIISRGHRSEAPSAMTRVSSRTHDATTWSCMAAAHRRCLR